MKHHKKGFKVVKHPPHCRLKLSPWEEVERGKSEGRNDKISFYFFPFVSSSSKPAVKLLPRKIIFLVLQRFSVKVYDTDGRMSKW